MSDADVKPAEAKKTVRVTQVNSALGRKPGQKATLVGLGLNNGDESL